MNTSKPISTISYNTPEFLREKISYLRKTGFIEYAMWIQHKPETDETKTHFHLYMKPAKLIQTVDIVDILKEPVKGMENAPEDDKKKYLGVASFRPSKEDDWLLYAIHDPVYLVEKGLEREYIYSFDDVERTCDDTFADIVSHLSDNRKGRLEYRIMECINLGLKWADIVRSGVIPMRQMHNALLFYKSITMQLKDVDCEVEVLASTAADAVKNREEHMYNLMKEGFKPIKGGWRSPFDYDKE